MAYLVGVVVGAVIGNFIRLWRYRVPGLAFSRSIRCAFYLSRYDWALDYYGLPGRERRSQVKALRADLGSVDPNGIDAALRGLGPARTLAAEVTTEVTSGTLRPSWGRGGWWGLGAMLAYLIIGVFVTAAFLGGFEAVAAPGDQASWSGFGFDLSATMGDNGGVERVFVGGPAFFLLPLGAFVLGARPWRLLSQSKPEPETSPSAQSGL